MLRSDRVRIAVRRACSSISVLSVLQVLTLIGFAGHKFCGPFPGTLNLIGCAFSGFAATTVWVCRSRLIPVLRAIVMPIQAAAVRFLMGNPRKRYGRTE